MIAVWAEASRDEGIGHAIRARTLARALLAVGEPVRVLALPTDAAEAVLGTSDLAWERLDDGSADEVTRRCAAVDARALVVDLPQAAFEARGGELAARLPADLPQARLDDRSPGAAVCDLLVLALAGDDAVPLPSGPRILEGPEWLAIEPPARRTRDRERFERAFVAVGGSELRTMSTQVAAVCAAAGLDVERVDDAAGRPGRVAAKLAAVDVAVVGMGVLAYEAAAAGVPAIVLASGERQSMAAAALATRGVCIATVPDGLPKALRRLEDERLRARLSAAGPRLVDGHGAGRLAREVAELARAGDPSPA